MYDLIHISLEYSNYVQVVLLQYLCLDTFRNTYRNKKLKLKKWILS